MSIGKHKSKTIVVKNAPKEDGDRKARGAPEGAVGVVIAKPTVVTGNGSHESIYQDAVREIKTLGENDSYAKKIDHGPLGEARGHETWRLHAQLRSVDQLDHNVVRHVEGVRRSLSEIDDHLHTDTVAITTLVEKHGSALAGSLAKYVAVLEGQVETLENHLQTSVQKLSQATAGSEENLRTQTNAFSKEVSTQVSNLHAELAKQIQELRDETMRLVDKRFNQADIAFAAVRADQEVIKALLTDIIKDRLGRPEPRTR